MSISPPNFLRNVAIIAHVDHGKTTLVDALLSQSGTLSRDNINQVCILDSDPIERERGITIFSKNCALNYDLESGEHAGETVRINLIDTPGHADFGGEVERVLRMADGALLLVDAFEGPMPQTRFVLQKALELNLKIVLVINKCDRPNARPDDVQNEVFDLLVTMGADDDTLDFTTIFASGRDGWGTLDHDLDHDGTVRPVLETIVNELPAPAEDNIDAPLQMLITSIEYSEYIGRIAVGRVYQGRLKSGQFVSMCHEGGVIRKARALKVLQFEGLGKKQADEIRVGDLCAVEGLGDFEIGDTICDVDNPAPMDRVDVDQPTLHMLFRINDSPLGGRDGKFVTSRQISERLDRELRSNVALKVEPAASSEEFRVSGRGLLHLGILIENMRREGFELSVGRPEVIERMIDGERCEPIEHLTLDLDTGGMGPALELLGNRGGNIQSVDTRGDRMHIEAEIPARGLIGLRSRLLTATGGEAIMYHSFKGYEPSRDIIQKRANGVMIATETGKATTYALLSLSERGLMFVETGDDVYAGQIVGENARDKDMPVNAVRAKAFSNVRESNKEATVVLKAARKMSLEESLEYIANDELVEVTPKVIRIRKRILDEGLRKRIDRQAKNAAVAAGA